MTSRMREVLGVAQMLYKEHRIEPFLSDTSLSFDMVLGHRLRDCFIEIDEREQPLLQVLLGSVSKRYDQVLAMLAKTPGIQSDAFQQDDEHNLLWCCCPAEEVPLIDAVRILLGTADYNIKRADGVIEHLLAGTEEQFVIKNHELLTMLTYGGMQ